MKNKKNMRRFLSGFLAMLTVLSTILSPMLSYAADVVPAPEEPPLYEEVKNELDADEVVKAKIWNWKQAGFLKWRKILPDWKYQMKKR